MKALARATLVVRSGGDLDEWLGGAIDSAGADAPSSTCSTRVGRRGRGPALVAGPAAPRTAVTAIGAALAKADPAGAPYYEPTPSARPPPARARRRRARLHRADPAEQRTLVTTHDALGYYARRYGIEVVGTVIPSLSTQAQASAGDLAELVDTIRRERVKAIFAESSVNAERRGGDRAGGRRARRPAAVGGLARPRGLGGGDIRGLDPRQHRRDRRGAHGGRRECARSRADPRRALRPARDRRARCCWPCSPASSARGSCCAGCLLHARGGHGDVPGPGRGRAVGRAAAAAALGARSASAAGSSGSRARAGWTPDAATGLLLVAALALGVVLASDVYESGAGVDRLLFGTLIGLTERDLALTAAAPRCCPARARRDAPRVAGDRLRPGQRPRARRAHARSPTACCWPPWRSRSSSRSTPSARCWSPCCSSCPPPPCRSFGRPRAHAARRRRRPDPLRGRAGLVDRRRRRRPGPAVAVMGGVLF